ncbi:glycosyl hydrolase, partial [Spirillospora sp. NPDC046719]
LGPGLRYPDGVSVSGAVAVGGAVVAVRFGGARPGREVVQVYAAPDGPPLRLAGFAVAEAAAGERVTVRVPLDERLPGGCAVRAGRSVADLRLTA